MIQYVTHIISIVMSVAYYIYIYIYIYIYNYYIYIYIYWRNTEQWHNGIQIVKLIIMFMKVAKQKRQPVNRNKLKKKCLLSYNWLPFRSQLWIIQYKCHIIVWSIIDSQVGANYITISNFVWTCSCWLTVLFDQLHEHIWILSKHATVTPCQVVGPPGQQLDKAVGPYTT